MIKRFLQIVPIALASLLIISVSSCLKPVAYPDEPELESVSYVISPDSTLLLSIAFTDGDGDIGLNASDTTAPFNSSSFYHFNLYLEYYELMNGTWVKGTQDPSGENFPTADTINFSYRIKNLTPIGQNKTLKGVINVTVEPVFFYPLSNHNDSIKYKITLIDRAKNISNSIETDTIVK